MDMHEVVSLIRDKMAGHVNLDVTERFLNMLNQIDREQSRFVPMDEVSVPDSTWILDSDQDSNRLGELAEKGEALLHKAAVIKLNGGRSTTMGGDVPKGILEAKNGRSYLEIIVDQAKAMETRWGTRVPLVLMNSFFTHGPSMELMERLAYPVRTFIQSQVPRLVRETHAPLDTGSDADWAPAGHGEVYYAMSDSGLLDQLLNEGFQWAFISNVDNLAATVDPWILGLLQEEEIEFLMEITDRTPADRKGGTVVLLEGRPYLLEIAQVAPDERDQFMNIERFRVFNTNNIWIDLMSLKRALTDGSLYLPIIQNFKTIDGTEVIQLETAMGAAIDSFPRARALRVHRDRFFPTKKAADLFVLQSDACVLDDMSRIRRNPHRSASLSFLPRVTFSPDFLDTASRIPEHFDDPSSVSLVAAESLTVSGPVFFGRNVTVEGSVTIEARQGNVLRIADGTILKDGTYP